MESERFASGDFALQAKIILDRHSQMGLRILDKNHTIPVTNCLTTIGCFQYTEIIRRQVIAHEKTVSRRMDISFD